MSQGPNYNIIWPLGSGGGGGSGITSLSGDVTATGPGAATATVTSAGGGTGAFAAGIVTAAGVVLPLTGVNLLWGGATNGFGSTAANELALINNNILTALWGADNSTSLGGALNVGGISTFNGDSVFNALATFYGSIFSAGGKFDVNPLLTQEIATPTATAGYGSTYTYTDGNLHYMSPTGTDYTLTPPASGGGVTGSGTSGQVTYWNGTSAVTGSSNLTFDGTNLTLATGGTVKTSELTLTNGENPALNISMPGTTTLYSVTMPGAQGTGALTNNGSGVLSWTPVTAATFANESSAFTVSTAGGQFIYFVTGTTTATLATPSAGAVYTIINAGTGTVTINLSTNSQTVYDGNNVATSSVVLSSQGSSITLTSNATSTWFSQAVVGAQTGS